MSRAGGPIRPIRRAKQAVAYAWPETPATGLRKFNLGTIPASVTPPRTWRKAAWFAVGTATFVVVALGFATYLLVGNPKRNTTIDALPGQPSQQLLITDLPADEAATGAPSSARPTSSAPARTTTTTPPRPKEAGHRARPEAPAPGQSVGASNSVRPTRPAAAPTGGAPARSTVEPAALTPTDPDRMGDLTEAYYAHVVNNPAAACALTTGRMRGEGPEGIEARYSDIERVEVKEIMIDPNWSFTRNVLVIVRKDGSTVTVRRELTFSSGANPRITGDSEA